VDYKEIESKYDDISTKWLIVKSVIKKFHEEEIREPFRSQTDLVQELMKQMSCED